MLFFLADSPMHAEITATPNPGTSLNPCRMCNLHAPSKLDKRSLSYLLQFLQLDSDGFHSPNVPRQWEKTIENTYNLFNTYLTVNITEVKRLRLIYGVTDSINNKFIDGIRSKSPVVTKKAGELIKPIQQICSILSSSFKASMAAQILQLRSCMYSCLVL
ncbi:uncharacterized protein PGTG_21553 [Puccinia graminis f. sp. tritici CRL 75-36-700-3]|uniref:Uncharacterized protein n=1 Tax=Puccinia graminis f. sp. tritici (strain CRL 75-36-700-3 / race SCCL) TaxID=418459 RepID=H6QRY5_PUCGT|nr:uncharacterized protein PGTG_21553 [Puccinia graminis f. sp. tritici CRL 75-36-700-3]EHS63420.1 hypothetical protein PGTG_21553 [Puccinia graminis f. sp. tritici CRL 75-36-700-3]